MSQISQIGRTSIGAARDIPDTRVASFSKQQLLIYLPFRNIFTSVSDALQSTVYAD